MMDWLNNICWLSDSYKVSHKPQYPPKTKKIRSYFEPRIGAKFDETVFFGLQYWLENYLAGQVVTAEKIDQAEKLFKLHFGNDVFNRSGWELILNKHGGKLPLEIKAVPEGTVVGTSNMLMAVENTDDELDGETSFWLVNYLETLLVQVWYPCTVATQSREMKKIILNYLHKTGDPSLIDFKLHDFGFRGVTCPEQSAIGGAAHLVNFKGTDTFSACVMLNKFYNEEMAGFSIPAAEHSTITSWGRENELEACRNMLDVYPTGNVAVVSDSYSIWNSCGNIWGGTLKDKVLSRDGVLVVRPDSGNPPDVVVKVLEILGDKFGTRVNNKGYRVLNDKVRVIQGDGIDFEMLKMILENMTKNGWSADNVAFGSGGGLLQKLNRDTQKFAFKCCEALIENENGIVLPRDVYKDPVTDPGKQSKFGHLKLINYGNKFITVRADDPKYKDYKDQLVTVFKNGEITFRNTLNEVRNRAMTV